MSAVRESPTAALLRNRIRRYNRTQEFYSAVIFVCAAVCWILTVCVLLIVLHCIHRYCLSAHHTPLVVMLPVNFTLTALFLTSVTALVHYQKPLFWKTQESPDIPYKSVQESYLSVSGLTFFLALLCLAPLTTVVAFQILEKRIKPHSEIFSLACQIYDNIAKISDWLPYPQLESQRNAVCLLAAAGLVQIAKRFGKIQVLAKQ